MEADPNIADEICTRMMGGESLKTICADEHMPTRRTVFYWLTADEPFRRRYEIARQMLADLLFDEIKDISDDGRNDFMERLAAEGTIERVPDHENIQRSKLRVDTRKWMASKLMPRKYGDRIGVDITTPFDHAAALAAARKRAGDRFADNPSVQPPILLEALSEGRSHIHAHNGAPNDPA